MLCLSLCQGGGGLVFERGLGSVDDFAKRGGIGGGDVGDDLAVEGDFRGLEAFHKSAVGQASFADGGIDARLPEVAEGALFGAAIAVGVLPAMVNGVGGVAVKFAAFEA